MRTLLTSAKGAAIALALSVVGASTSQAQLSERIDNRPAARRAADSASAAPASWRDRVSVVVRYDRFQPAGHSQFFTLVDRALSPGAGAIHPALFTGELRLRLGTRWELVGGGETGGTTVASSSIARPAGSSSDVHQSTSLDLTNTEYLGANWLAWRWSRGEVAGADRLRVKVGAGAGLSSYRLRQVGEFVDVQRDVTFHDDLRSAGRGTFTYLSAAAEAPLRPWLSLEADLRRRAGSAPMNADYASFDRIDMSGYSFGLGVQLQPFNAFARHGERRH